jgi:hypothetical protein
MGLAILKRDAEGTKLVHYKDYVMARDCEIECVLEPGSYIVVPRTTGCAIRRPLEAQAEGIRLLDGEGNPSELFESTVADIFRKFDLVISNTIDFKEIKGLYDIIGKKITEIEFKTQVLGQYCSSEGGLTEKGFK